ncbi:hypothetical protein [Salimicrobium album]|uniref:Uncharacterized protein n=1 Tax=Salimicrobium album TaxID=50717 RepID=A0A1H3D6Y9_9BACI|nr:hypothetical protein [Salimicrobium album]SDX62116.1 hypothetical protein SAMN04488081_0853 [Salimicrobium album]
MAVKSYARGHSVMYVDGQWVYTDNGEPISNNERECSFCECKTTTEGHDGCLGTLPGVVNACCGHGLTERAYIQFENGMVDRGKSALLTIKIMKQTKAQNEEIDKKE